MWADPADPEDPEDPADLAVPAVPADPADPEDLADLAVPGPSGPRGPRGPRGPSGPRALSGTKSHPAKDPAEVELPIENPPSGSHPPRACFLVLPGRSLRLHPCKTLREFGCSEFNPCEFGRRCPNSHNLRASYLGPLRNGNDQITWLCSASESLVPGDSDVAGVAQVTQRIP
eukprot:gene24916-biopygen2201